MSFVNRLQFSDSPRVRVPYGSPTTLDVRSVTVQVSQLGVPTSLQAGRLPVAQGGFQTRLLAVERRIR